MNVRAGTMSARLADALADAEVERADELRAYREEQKNAPKYRLAKAGDELTLVPAPRRF